MHRTTATLVTVTSALAAVALAGGVATATAPASAEPTAEPTVEVLASGLVGPLSLAVAEDGTRYVTDDFTGTLYQQAAGTTDGSLTPIYQNPTGGEVGGVSTEAGQLRFTQSGARGHNQRGKVLTLGPRGARTVANTGAYEKAVNPDGDQTYGFRGIGRACAAQLPRQFGPANYQGVIETHPYNTELADGTTYLADAAGNDILAIAPDGAIRTVAVIHPRTLTITPETAASSGLPDCAVGKSYRFEPVPTDVEMGPDGYLYVTTLSGGPEDGSLGATGQLLRIDPVSGATSLVTRGLLSATGVGVAPDGDVYVAELFAGQILRIPAGTRQAEPFASVPLPADVDVAADGIYATIGVLPGDMGPTGELVRITPSVS